MEQRRGVVSGELFAGEVENATVFIVDDMISTGGTMLRAAEACRKRGTRAVYAMGKRLFRVPPEGVVYSLATGNLRRTADIETSKPVDYRGNLGRAHSARSYAGVQHVVRRQPPHLDEPIDDVRGFLEG
ncbi:phosphoribosyltransferase family protein [Sinorhizobium sp. 7-81]|uniref:phosphoribosyltransferase family protein n=1 Tax=Sinorhizobium sp. 8-89 TaxID=3049089 RepID=UPI0024C2235C|nr:phosphoribosyltransferase family protein [Sinorhizobium sp. 8-89]MDK1491225.1 phosphoribosyltransferase family protein [Sinorhizobium sp. 8-89]